MKKILLITLALCLVATGAAFGVGVVLSDHDLSGKLSGSNQVCVFCHHPHRGPGGTADVGTTVLWNLSSFSQTGFTTYDSATMNAVGGNVLSKGGNSSYSFLCMACHDGAVAADSLYQTAGGVNNDAFTITGVANLGSTLQDDHPVDFIYEGSADIDTGIKTADAGNDRVVGTGNIYPLFNKTMQCATCHDVHRGDLDGAVGADGYSKDANIEFMLGDTSGSEICTDCHIDK
jgi:hypothetical protein